MDQNANQALDHVLDRNIQIAMASRYIASLVNVTFKPRFEPLAKHRFFARNSTSQIAIAAVDAGREPDDVRRARIRQNNAQTLTKQKMLSSEVRS